MRFSMLYSEEQILSFKSCLVFYAGDSLNIGSLSLLRVSFIADRSLVLIFALQEREWRPCTTGSH